MPSTKKPARVRQAVAPPRRVDYTQAFLKDWERLGRTGRYDLARLKTAMLLLIAGDAPLGPEGILDAAHLSLPELRRELALTLYAQQRLSLGKARELVGLTLWEFRQWLALRRIPAHYDESDVQDDLDALRELGGLA